MGFFFFLDLFSYLFDRERQRNYSNTRCRYTFFSFFFFVKLLPLSCDRGTSSFFLFFFFFNHQFLSQSENATQPLVLVRFLTYIHVYIEYVYIEYIYNFNDFFLSLLIYNWRAKRLGKIICIDATRRFLLAFMKRA